MPHIHTEPGQRDITVSAYIVRREGSERKCLVHFHRKIEVLMQIGGHIDLDHTPWQALIEELHEEAGYDISQLDVLQPFAEIPKLEGEVVHPVPFTANTHNVGADHFHSDLCYGFVTDEDPIADVAAGESTDLRWLSIEELRRAMKHGEAATHCLHVYEYLLAHLDGMHAIPAEVFSREKPADGGLVYKRGTPGGR